MDLLLFLKGKYVKALHKNQFSKITKLYHKSLNMSICQNCQSD